MITEEFKNIQTNRKKVRQFGALLLAVALIIAFALYRKDMNGWYYAAGFAAALLMITIFWPSILAPLYRIWMMAAVVLGWFMTLVIMTVLYYFVLTPVSLVARICGKTFFTSGPESSLETYWNKRNEEFSRTYYEKQF